MIQQRYKKDSQCDAMQDESESGKGQAEKAGAKQFDVFDPDEHSKWELEATETE